MYKKYEDELKARQRSFVEMQSKFAKSEKCVFHQSAIEIVFDELL